MRCILLSLSFFTIGSGQLNVFPGDSKFNDLVILQNLAKEYVPAMKQLYETISHLEKFKNQVAQKLKTTVDAEATTLKWITQLEDNLVDLNRQTAVESISKTQPPVRIAKLPIENNSSETHPCTLQCDIHSCDDERSSLMRGPAASDSDGLEFQPTCYEPQLDTSTPVKCSNFEDPARLLCPAGMRRCAEIIPDGHMTFNMDVKTANSSSFVITGGNLSKCVRLAIVPEDRRCDDERYSVLDIIKSSEGLLAGNPTPLNEPKLIPYRDTEDSEIRDALLYHNVAVQVPGKYNLCLIQWAMKPVSATDRSSVVTDTAEKMEKSVDPGVVILGVYQADKLHVLP